RTLTVDDRWLRPEVEIDWERLTADRRRLSRSGRDAGARTFVQPRSRVAFRDFIHEVETDPLSPQSSAVDLGHRSRPRTSAIEPQPSAISAQPSDWQI